MARRAAAGSTISVDEARLISCSNHANRTVHGTGRERLDDDEEEEEEEETKKEATESGNGERSLADGVH